MYFVEDVSPVKNIFNVINNYYSENYYITMNDVVSLFITCEIIQIVMHVIMVNDHYFI